MKHIRVKLFKEEPLCGDILAQMEHEAFTAFGFHAERPYFFVHIRRRDLIEQFALLSEKGDETAGAGQVTCVFADSAKEHAFLDGAFALAAFLKKGRENGIEAKPLAGFRDVFNDPRHKELKEVCGVPAGYYCIGAAALGISAESAEQESAKPFNLSSYVQ